MRKVAGAIFIRAVLMTALILISVKVLLMVIKIKLLLLMPCLIVKIPGIKEKDVTA